MKGSWQDFWNEQAIWSEKTFGTTEFRGPIGPLKHSIKEINELIEALESDDNGKRYEILEECVDLIFLAFDAARRSGFTYLQLFKRVWLKLDQNKKRTWGPQSANEPTEHVRS